MASIALQNVSKDYGRKHLAVRQFNLDIQSGELMVLVGPSGCGKTTTLRLIAGLESPDEGEILIDRRLVNRLAPKKRNVAMIFQDFSLYPHLTARKNLSYVLKLQRRKRAEIAKRIEWAVNLTRIQDLLDRKPGQMSGGERQRVALAAALVRKPACHLLDEPLSNLDAVTRRRLRTDIKSIHRESGATMLHVTHDQEEAMSLGDRIAVMRKGRIQQFGTPQQLYHQPENRFVAGFLGNPPMNFIDGHLQAENGQIFFRDGHGLEFQPPKAMKDRLGQPRVREIVVGLRPDSLQPLRDDDSRDMAFQAEVLALESFGDRLDIHVSTPGGAILITSTPAEGQFRGLSPGQPIRLGVDPSRMLLFEPGEKGKRISDDQNE